ncbi:MAG: EscU/YscU/HrcU family type III secretion system export apparatus switch protein [Myxococcales bacterium]|nr:EscU/YscU/HrcU family type III secretion system export apparatus switch protein [Myxococcales bacterium]
MSEHRSGEPTEPPSQKKLRDARSKGDVAKSREVVSAAVFLVVAGAFAATWPQLVGQLRALVQRSLAAAPRADLSPTAALDLGLSVMTTVLTPLLVAAVVAALIASFAQVGSLFSLSAIKPQLNRLDPFKNIKNILGKRALFELFKSALKVVGLGYLAATVLLDHAPAILATLGKPPERALEVIAAALASLSLRVGGLAVVLAGLDLLYQRRAYFKRQRMTKEEVKREHKEAEGDPQHKAERQRVHREIVEHQSFEAVRHADCVIVNPTHVAVAIKYDEGEMDAPRVVARGQRLAAARIKQIARQYGVPVIRNVPLARALVDLEVDDEIPAELYEAVAEVLRFVYSL